MVHSLAYNEFSLFFHCSRDRVVLRWSWIFYIIIHANAVSRIGWIGQEAGIERNKSLDGVSDFLLKARPFVQLSIMELKIDLTDDSVYRPLICISGTNYNTMPFWALDACFLEGNFCNHKPSQSKKNKQKKKKKKKRKEYRCSFVFIYWNQYGAGVYKPIGTKNMLLIYDQQGLILPRRILIRLVEQQLINLHHDFRRQLGQ